MLVTRKDFDKYSLTDIGNDVCGLFDMARGVVKYEL